MRGQEAGISCQIGLLCVRLKNTKINIEKETRKKWKRENAVNKSKIRSSNERYKKKKAI